MTDKLEMQQCRELVLAWDKAQKAAWDLHDVIKELRLAPAIWCKYIIDGNTVDFLCSDAIQNCVQNYIVHELKTLEAIQEWEAYQQAQDYE